MTLALPPQPPSYCGECGDGTTDRALLMAFQPIVNTLSKSVFAYEALVRGPCGEAAGTVFGRLTAEKRHSLDQDCRITALEIAASLDLCRDGAALSVNFLPSTIHSPRACFAPTLQAAARVGFPADLVIFEITESDAVADPAHLAEIVAFHRAAGVRTALDDFGSGFSNLNYIVQFRPDIVKLDMVMIRDIDTDPVRQCLLRHIVAMCADLGIALVAEGIETLAEYDTVTALGVTLLQGFLLARPGLMTLPTPVWPQIG